MYKKNITTVLLPKPRVGGWVSDWGGEASIFKYKPPVRRGGITTA